MTNTLRRIEVEPLSEQRWARVEHAVFARLELAANDGIPDAGRRVRTQAVRLWALAAALGALAVVWLVVRGLPDRAVIDQPSRITTGASASHLALPGLSLDVEPQSAVIVGAETAGGQLIVLERGTIVCEVATRSNEAPLIVQAGATRVRVIGTRFRVTRLGEAAAVEVQHGMVEVTTRGGAWQVKAGEEWTPKLARRSVENDLDAKREGAARSGAVPPIAEQAEDEAGAREATEKPEKPLGERMLPERGSSIARPRSTPSARPPGDETRASARASVAEPDAAAGKPSRSSQVVFEQATALERSDPGAASQLYRSLESGGDSWAQNALYARGRLAASRGNAVEARRALQQYLERFPRGSNAEDARAVLRRLR